MYSRTTWANDPATTSPLSAGNLNKMEDQMERNSHNKNYIIDGGMLVSQVYPVLDTTITDPLSGVYTAHDLYKLLYNVDGGSLPTIEHSRTLDTSDATTQLKVNVDGAGSSFGNGSYYGFKHYIEQGETLLAGQTCTLSLYAKTDIVGKKLALFVNQNFGSGGSADVISQGEVITLTNILTRYTVTFDIGSISGKTIGANSYLGINIVYQWGTTYASGRFTPTTAEDFVDAGDIFFTNIKFEIGELASDFIPENKLDARDNSLYYYNKSFNNAIAPARQTGVTDLGLVSFRGDGASYPCYTVQLQKRMRTNATITLYNPQNASADEIYNQSDAANLADIVENKGSKSFVIIVNNVITTAGDVLKVHWTADPRF